MNMDIFDGNRFVIQPKLKDGEDTGSIMDEDMTLLCYIKHHHSWKGVVTEEIRATNIRLEGIDGAVLREIHENPELSGVRVVRTWGIYDAKGELRGVVEEKMKLIGSHWVLESPEGDEIVTIKGNRKKHKYEVLTKGKQPIARCNPINKDVYIVDIQRSDFNSFLVLCYIVVQDHVSSWRVQRGFGPRRRF
jgi:hypothetical protein